MAFNKEQVKSIPKYNTSLEIMMIPDSHWRSSIFSETEWEKEHSVPLLLGRSKHPAFFGQKHQTIDKKHITSL